MEFEEWDDVDFVISKVKTRGGWLYCASPRLRNNKTVVMAAIEQNGWALMYAKKAMREDEDIVLAALRRTKKAVVLEEAGRRLLTNANFAKKAVEIDSDSLQYLSKKFQNDYFFVTFAIQEDNRQRLEHIARRRKDKRINGLTVFLIFMAEKL